MKTFLTRSRLKNIVIVFLLISNIATIGTIYFHRWKFKHKFPHEVKENKIDSFIVNEIGFTAEQKIKFEEDKKTFLKEKDSLLRNFRNYKRAMWKEYAEPNPQQSVLDSLSKIIGDNFIALNKANSNHYYKLLEICNDAQKIKLKEKYKEMSENDSVCSHNRK